MKNEDEDVVQLPASPADIQNQDVALIDVAVATARKYPRNLKRVTDNSIAIATTDKPTAESCHYVVPRGGKSISGPTVHLAKILAQQYGNMRVESRVVDISDKVITSQAVAWDLETNLAVKVEVKRSILTKEGRRFTDDMVTVTGNASNAIAMRNAVFAVVPRAIVDKVYNSAKEVITGKLSDEKELIKKRKQVVDGLMQTYNVTEKEVLDVIGRADVSHITPDDIVVLVGIGQAIKDGDTSVNEAFRSTSTKARPTPQTKKQKEHDRVKELINDCKDLKDLEKLMPQVAQDDELMELYVTKEAELMELKTGKK